MIICGPCPVHPEGTHMHSFHVQFLSLCRAPLLLSHLFSFAPQSIPCADEKLLTYKLAHA